MNYVDYSLSGRACALSRLFFFGYTHKKFKPMVVENFAIWQIELASFGVTWHTIFFFGFVY
jgi:hypothetical protein